ncbi:helix-turn-helix transcriptional regulator, partial [Dysosmobacter welbionis]
GSLGLPDPHVINTLIVLHPVCKILFHRGAVISIVTPFVLPQAVFVIITGPCDIAGWRGGMFAQCKST